MSGYTALITSEHADKPRFVAVVDDTTRPYSDITAAVSSMVAAFDLDSAVGVQLDAVGVRVGRSRVLTTPLSGVYFAIDEAGVGFDQGTWLGEYDPVSGLTSLPDDTYRALLRAKILANMWDGTVPGAYAAWRTVFQGTGYQIIIQDNGDMTMAVGLVGPTPDAVTLALFTGGYLSLKPMGVGISYYAVPTAPNVPFFGFDAQSAGIAGFDTGAFANLILPS